MGYPKGVDGTHHHSSVVFRRKEEKMSKDRITMSVFRLCYYPKYILTNQYVVWVEHPFQTQWHRKQGGKGAIPPENFVDRSRNRRPTKDSVRWNNLWLHSYFFFLGFIMSNKHTKGLWFHLIIFQDATSLVFWHNKT